VGGQAGRACWGGVARGVTSRRPPYPPPPTTASVFVPPRDAEECTQPSPRTRELQHPPATPLLLRPWSSATPLGCLGRSCRRRRSALAPASRLRLLRTQGVVPGGTRLDTTSGCPPPPASPRGGRLCWLIGRSGGRIPRTTPSACGGGCSCWHGCSGSRQQPDRLSRTPRLGTCSLPLAQQQGRSGGLGCWGVLVSCRKDLQLPPPTPGGALGCNSLPCLG